MTALNDTSSASIADGKLTSQTYPNGVVAATHYDNTGDATSLTYDFGGTPWMTFAQTLRT